MTTCYNEADKIFKRDYKKYIHLLRSKNRIVSTCMRIFKKIFKDPQFILKKITGHKAWFYVYNPNTKNQPSQKKSPSSLHAKKVRQVHSVWRAQVLCFLALTESCIMNSSHRGKLKTNISILMFCGTYGKMCGENNPLSILELSFSITTILLLTLLGLCTNFWLKMAWQLY